MTRLTIDDTNVLKGVAILLMLWHHLFRLPDVNHYNDLMIHGHGLVYESAEFSKLCVAIFVFLSGYGLAVKYGSSNTINLKDFYRQRFSKLMLNYWYVWLIVVPLSVFVLGPDFNTAYGSTDYLIPRIVLDFLGILNWVGPTVYNFMGAWWFYGCIIGLYLLFPILHRGLNKMPFFTIASIIAIFYLPTDLLFCVRIYLPTFIVGMLVAPRSKESNNSLTPPLWVWIIALGIIFIGRFKTSGNDFYIYDAFIMLVSTYVYQYIKINARLKSILKFLGKYSMDMFLIHGFFYKYWLHDLIYSTGNPIIIYIELVMISLIGAMLIEKSKKVIGFYKLVNILRGKARI